MADLLGREAENRRKEHGGIKSAPAHAKQQSNSSCIHMAETDHLLVQRIHEAVTEANRSNITRTRAYLEYYEQFPEIHWALLAHMVSRNAGWGMTDLKGGLLSDLTDHTLKERLYRLLERCNALIFQDAYPQLLLYKFSREREKSCFHLLPCFQVSSFMTPIWDRFWLDRNSAVLSVALIINEQNYIEGRVIQHPFFREQVLDHPSMRMFEWGRLNQLLFPLGQPGSRHDLFRDTVLPLRPLTGQTMHNFRDVSTRIRAGKSLYAMLFGYTDVCRGVLSFARSTPHLGSRSEYWPALFTYIKEEAGHSDEQSRELMEAEWLSYGKRLYSPRLEEVWNDTEYDPIPRYDWFQDEGMLRHLTKPHRPLFMDMTHTHRSALERMALAHDGERIESLPRS